MKVLHEGRGITFNAGGFNASDTAGVHIFTMAGENEVTSDQT